MNLPRMKVSNIKVKSNLSQIHIKPSIPLKKRNTAKFSISFQGDQISFSEKVFWRSSFVQYGEILAAVTSDGQPCAILLHPIDQTKQDFEQSMLIELKSRLPSKIKLIRDEQEKSIENDHIIASEMLDRLIKYVQDQSNTQTDSTKFIQEAKFLQSKSILYGTSFQHSVWRSMAKVPIGQVYTYSQLTRKAGQSSNSVRAVAQACGTNPLTFLLPCHRIVAQGGGLGGYHWGTTTKQAILRDEKAIAATLKLEEERPKGKVLKLLRS